MSALDLLNPVTVLMEFREHLLTVCSGNETREWTLERGASGRLEESCKTRVQQELSEFVGKSAWQPKRRAWCGISARGVSFRRLKLPRSSREELRRLVALQIEGEFPLPPDQLAWGYLQLDSRNGASNGPIQEVLVAAVRREILDDYATLLHESGLAPIFTIAGLARACLCPHPVGRYAVLDVGRQSSEWLSFDTQGPLSARVISWSPARETDSAPSANGDSRALTGSLPALEPGERIFLTGSAARDKAMTTRVCEAIGNGVDCESLELSSGDAAPASIRGLRRAMEKREAPGLLVLQSESPEGRSVLARPASWRWVAIVAALILAVLSLPYLEALMFRNHVASQLQTLKAAQPRLLVIDREFGFLRYLKQNQPPYLDALFILSKTVPPGSRVESLTMNRRGEFTLKASTRTSQEIVDFRSKLVDSGFFSTVVIDEQTPTPDRQKVNFRMTAQWKAGEARENLPVLALEEQPAGTTDSGKKP